MGRWSRPLRLNTHSKTGEGNAYYKNSIVEALRDDSTNLKHSQNKNAPGET